MTSNWLGKEVSLYKCYSDNVGRAATYRDILFTQFAVPHQWCWYDKITGITHKGSSSDLETLIELRKLDRLAPDYKIRAKELKNRLQCYTPAALLASKTTGNVIEISRTSLMQIDFDYDDISEYEIEELMQCVFKLPFIAFCGLSCSGYGFYALALIAEPERLKEYAIQCFEVFKFYGVNPDESKGKKPENLRFISYDSNMLIRENPEPLLIKRFRLKPATKKELVIRCKSYFNKSDNAALDKGLNLLLNVKKGRRWNTIQKVAYSIGGLGNPEYLLYIKNIIKTHAAFEGEENEFIKCADDCFKAGQKNLFIKKI